MDQQTVVLDFTDDAKITNPVTPQSGQFATQRFAKIAGIAGAFKARLQPVKNAGRRGTIQFGELLLRKRRDFNRPGQVFF